MFGLPEILPAHPMAPEHLGHRSPPLSRRIRDRLRTSLAGALASIGL